MYKFKVNDQATFLSPAEEWVLPAASTKEPEEIEFVVDSGASMHLVSKRETLVLLSLETMRISRSPTTVNDSQRRGANKSRTRRICERIGLVRDSYFLKKLPQFFLSENSAKITGIITIGPVVRNHISSKMERELIALE